MIRAGDTIENPITGERIVFRQTSRETNGQAVVIETYVQPNGFVAAAHVHPSQEERFEVLRGSVGFRIGRKKLVAGPGQRITVPAGTPHKFWNAGDEPCRILEIIAPGGFERFFAELVDAAAAGPVDPEWLAGAGERYGHYFDYASIPVLCERFGVRFGA